MMCCQPDSHLPLLQCKQRLEEALKELTRQRDERLGRLRELKATERQLCAKLTKQPCDVLDGTVPSQKQLDQLKEYVRSLECDKVRI